MQPTRCYKHDSWLQQTVTIMISNILQHLNNSGTHKTGNRFKHQGASYARAKRQRGMKLQNMKFEILN